MPAFHDTERELVGLLETGSRTAFTHLYHQYYPRLFRYAYLVTRSKETSDEILQDVFLKLWIKRATISGVRSLDNYLFFMVRNRLFDERRQADRHRKWLSAAGGDEPFANDPQDELLLKEYHALVQKAIGLMPERRQKIFRMNALEEMSAREIASELNLSVPAVKKQLYEAQHFLREYLKEHGDVLIALMMPAMWQLTSA